MAASSQASVLLLLPSLLPVRQSKLLLRSSCLWRQQQQRRRLWGVPAAAAVASAAAPALSTTTSHYQRHARSRHALPGPGGGRAPLRRWASSHHNAAPPTTDDGRGGAAVPAFCLERSAEALLDAFQRYGHYEAQLDPLALAPISPRPELDPARYFPPSALHAPLPPSILSSILGPNAGGMEGSVTPMELAARLRGVYCQAVGFEVAHLDDADERAWLTRRIAELSGGSGGISVVLTPAERINAGVLMLQAEAFEHFLARKFPSFKRYSGEGAEAMQPAVDAILRTAHALGTEAAVIGMPHRGRLALLASQLDFPVRRMLHKVAGKTEFPAELAGVVDDVTSHLAASVDKHYSTTNPTDNTAAAPGRPPLRVSLLHNPSHLEIVGCVAAGKARAKRTARSAGRDAALCLQIHGDAAMSGQGCIQETLSLSRLKGFDVGGTVHLVVNNQLGFTTTQGEGGGEGRSSRYCTDVAKLLQAPIIHVNANDVDAVILACKLAVEYRAACGKDAFVDLHAYRLHGHNEVDEPAFTNPLTYHRVRDPSRPTPASGYLHHTLVHEGLMAPARVEQLRQRFDAHLEAEYEASLAYDITAAGQGPDAFKGKWKGMRHPQGDEDLHAPVDTGVPLETLHHIGARSVSLPTAFVLHPRLRKSFVDARLAALARGAVDWATAEALAVGSLLREGFDVRLCGQDVGRGTFSQRHFLLTDQETGEVYCPLAHGGDGGGDGSSGCSGLLEVVNSNLSELAVLGFEYGHSIESPKALGIWEAQFGDFSNGAQIVVDAFIAGGEAKWLRQSGLVLLLPHGYDGAGPEHSSARLERFLQLSNDVPPPPCTAGGGGGLDPTPPPFTNPNLLIQHPSTPANYFHALRRQLLRPFRKPLVVMAPKTLLRNPLALSPLTTMGPGASFQPILASTLDGREWMPTAAAAPAKKKQGKGKGKGKNGDGGAAGQGAPPPTPKAVVFCSGKVYYDVIKALSGGGAGAGSIDPAAVLIVRLEELSPLPRPALERLLDSVFLPGGDGSDGAPQALLWLQEEPLNAGAWAFVQPHLTALLQSRYAPTATNARRPLPPLEYIGRPALPTPAVGLGEAHKQQVAELMASLWARLGAAM